MGEAPGTRDAKGRFVKGHNAPGPGRPVGTTPRADFNRWAEDKFQGWLDKLIENGEFRFLVEQYMGRAQQAIEHSGETSTHVALKWADGSDA